MPNPNRKLQPARLDIFQYNLTAPELKNKVLLKAIDPSQPKTTLSN